MTYPNGDYYQGNWFNNLSSGKGFMAKLNEVIYRGE